MVIATRQSLTDRLDAGEHKLRQSARLTLALLARRLHGVIVDPARLHRSVGRRMQRIDELEYGLRDGVRAAIESRKRALDAASARLAQRDVRLQFAEARRRLEACETAVMQSMRWRIGRAQGALAPLAAHLDQLSPLKILERGYAIVELDGKIVKSPAEAPKGSSIQVRVAAGEFLAKVT
jgi:exodeoxyribonuclease VII large subunit